MSKALLIYLLLLSPLTAFSQNIGSSGGNDGAGQAVQHIDSVVTNFKQGKWQTVVAMFDSIVSNNYFTNNQLYYAVSESLRQLSEQSPPDKKDSLLKVSKEIYDESVDQWGKQVMEAGVDLRVYSIAEKAPEPTGGMKGFNDYVIENLEYPAKALYNKKEGRVFLQFVVNKDGTIDAVNVLRSLSPECDKEAIRLVKNAPRWTPGFQNGQPVFVRMVLPVTFNIREYQRALKVKNAR